MWWNQIIRGLRTESVAAQAIVQAFIAVGIAFGWWHWSPAQTGAVVGMVAAFLGMAVRSQVTPMVRPRAAGRPLIPDPSALPVTAARQDAPSATPDPDEHLPRYPRE
jgi:hypothetical protein